MSVYIPIPEQAAGTWQSGVAAEANLPASGNALYDARVSLDDESIFIWTGSAWVGVGGGGSGVTTVGAFSGSAQTDGATISGSTITFGPASNTVPGMVGTGAQTWAGVKTFSSAPIMSALTASLPVVTDGSKALSSVSYATFLASLGAAPTASPTFTGTITGTDMTLTNVQKITYGTTSLGNEAGQNSRLEIRLPSGGRFTAVENSQQLFTLLAESANWGAFALSRDWQMNWQMGKGTSHYGFGRCRAYGTNVEASSSTTEADLQSVTVQANEMPNNGEDLTIFAAGSTGANGNAKVVRLYFGGSVIGTISTSANAKVWKFSAVVSRTGASAQKYVTEMVIDGTVTIVDGTLAVSNAGTIIVKTTGEEVVTGKMLRVDYDRAGN